MNGKAPGRFITFEGGEGTGKSTQVARLAKSLRERGLEVVETREPGGAPGAEAIRRLLVEGEPGRWTPMTEALLHSAARSDHLARVVRPALASGKWVVCDRFTDSTLAYQGFGHGLGVELVTALNNLVAEGTRPDLTLILDMPVTEGLARAHGRRVTAENRYERMGRDFHERLREGYLAIARDEPDRCVVIDATADVVAVARAVERAVAARIGLK